MELRYLPVDLVDEDSEPIRVQKGINKTLKASIKKIGLVDPIVVTPKGDRYITLDGNMRLRILKSLRWCKVAAYVTDHPDELFKLRANIIRREI